MRTARSYQVALANLQLTMRTRLALCSQRATCLRLEYGDERCALSCRAWLFTFLSITSRVHVHTLIYNNENTEIENNL